MMKTKQQHQAVAEQVGVVERELVKLATLVGEPIERDPQRRFSVSGMLSKLDEFRSHWRDRYRNQFPSDPYTPPPPPPAVGPYPVPQPPQPHQPSPLPPSVGPAPAAPVAPPVVHPAPKKEH